MRNNRIYTFFFAFLVCLVCASALGFAVEQLRDKQEVNVQVDIYKNILRAVGLSDGGTNAEIEARFKKSIKIVGLDGKEVASAGDTPNPIFLKIGSDNVTIDAYAIPIQGKGLWSTLYGYFALDKDLNTVKGITFYKHGETPGLGAEVEKDWFTNNFKGKKILDKDDKLVSIDVLKGKAPAGAKHEVDGISGATFTSVGVSKFLKANLRVYMKYFKKKRAEFLAAQTAQADTAAPTGEAAPNAGQGNQ